MAKQVSPYFVNFVTMAEYSVRAAELLQHVFHNYDPSTLDEKRKEMHVIEHDEDQIKHKMMKHLVKEFVTPIDREDIIQLANDLDTVTDTIEEVLVRLYMYNIQSIPSDVLQLTDLIVECCKSLHAATTEFPNYQKSKTLMQAIIDVNTLEEKGDRLYVEAIRTLYTTNTDPIYISSWRTIIDRLEDCFDACENVADEMEIVAMKNS